MGLHVAELATLPYFARSAPRSKYTNGAPPATTSSWPLTLLKNAVGRTTE